jgi:hypothetical protein
MLRSLRQPIGRKQTWLGRTSSEFAVFRLGSIFCVPRRCLNASAGPQILDGTRFLAAVGSTVPQQATFSALFVRVGCVDQTTNEGCIKISVTAQLQRVEGQLQCPPNALALVLAGDFAWPLPSPARFGNRGPDRTDRFTVKHGYTR